MSFKALWLKHPTLKKGVHPFLYYQIVMWFQWDQGYENFFMNNSTGRGSVSHHKARPHLKTSITLLELAGVSLNWTQIYVLALELTFVFFPREQYQIPSSLPQLTPAVIQAKTSQFLHLFNMWMAARLLSTSNCSSLNMLQVENAQWPGQKRISSCAPINIVLDGWLSLLWKPASHS